MFSPEPKLIELQADDLDSSRMQNLPIAYQNMTKRHARVVKGSLGAVHVEDRAAVEYFMQ